MRTRFPLLPLVILGLLFHSCGSIEVDEGPFTIEFDQSGIKGKAAYLNAMSQTGSDEERPNILLIIADDLGRDEISLYHPDGLVLPNLSRLASNGVLFTNAYSTSSVCSPSRASLMTGRYQHRFGFERQPMNRYPKGRLEYYVFDRIINTEPMRLISPLSSPAKTDIEKQGIPPEEVLLPEILQASGYATGLFGKWHLGFHEGFLPNERGFDQQYGFYEAFTYYTLPGTKDIISYRHDYFADKHIWRQKRKGSCAIRQNDSVIVEKEYLTFSIARQTNEFIEKHAGDDRPFFAYAAFSAPHTPFKVPLEYYNRYSEVADENRRIYCGMITALDDAIGMIIDKLEALDELDNTLILFASDNGGATYTGATVNGDLNAGKMTQFEGGVNIPCIISWQDQLPMAMVYEHPVSLMDFFTTALASADLPLQTDKTLDGVDLIPYLSENNETLPHESLFWRTDFNKSVRYKHWKLIWNARDNQTWLFNLENDKEEKFNLANEHPALVQTLKTQIQTWEMGLRDPAWPGVMEIRFEINGDTTWWAI